MKKMKFTFISPLSLIKAALLVLITSFSATSALAQCSPPTGVSITSNCDGSITFDWNAVPDADSYTLVIEQGGLPVLSYVNMAPTSVTVVTGSLDPGTAYEYGLTANCAPGVTSSTNGIIPAGTVLDTPPTITVSNIVPSSCPGEADGSFDVTVGADCGGSYDITVNGVTQTAGSGTTVTFSGLAGSPSGTSYTVSLALDDAGACNYDPACISAVSQTVTLFSNDTTDPVLTVFNSGGVIEADGSSQTFILPEGNCGMQLSWIAEAEDNCDDVSVDATISNPNPNVNPGPQVTVINNAGVYTLEIFTSTGTNILEVTATDGSGNETTQTFTLITPDITAPQIFGPGDMVVEVPSCMDQIPVNWSVSATDDCTSDPSLNQTAGQASGSFFTPGSYTISYQAEDDSGNTTTYSFNITVSQAASPSPIVDVSGNGQFVAPQCANDVFVVFSGNVISCDIDGDNPIAASEISISGAPLSVTYVNNNEGFAYFEATGNLAPGTYLIFVTYEGVTVDHLVTVIQQPSPSVNLACVNNINVSLNDNCEVVITPSMLLNGSFGCLTDDDFTIEIDGSPISNPISACGTYEYMIRLAPGVSANFSPCWGYITVEDKRTLFLECGTTELECHEALEIGFLGNVSEMCDGCQEVNQVLIREEIRNANCSNPAEDPFTTIIERTWRLTDAFGNISECTDVINVRRPSQSMGDYVVEDEVELPCDATPGDYHPSVIGYPVYTAGGVDIELDPTSASLICNLLIKFDDMELTGGCAGTRKIMRMWTITEWHCGTLVPIVVIPQTIVLKDNEGPIMDCSPLTDQVWTNPYECASDIFIPMPIVTDNCSAPENITVSLEFNGNPFVADFQGGVVTGFQPGENTLIFRAYDECGNSSSCERVITVVDEIAPIAVCKTFTVTSIGGDGTSRVFWPSFDDGSYDNCEIDRIEVRRMDGGQCNYPTVFGEFVEVCCADAAEPVIVVMRVTDINGNTNECMVELEVQDKLPAVLQAPPNITVECGFDLDDLSIFGTVANQNLGETRNPIIINGVEVGLDGFAFDNCDLTIDLSEQINLSVCGAGTITRTFTAVGAGNTTQQVRTQTITVEYNLDAFAANLRFPCDLTTEDLCVTDPSFELRPEVLEQFNGSGVSCNPGEPAFYDRPRFNDDVCNQLGVSYKDHVFEIQDSACYKVLREWQVIDWCFMEAFPGAPLEDAITRHTQVLKIKNTEAPVITCPSDITVCSFQEICSTGELLTRTATAVDDCTVEEDLFWQWQYFQNVGDASSFITAGAVPTASGNGPSVSRNFPVGTHVIRYVVEDKCGNTAACTSAVTVEDCKKPTPVCHDLVTTLMPNTTPDNQMVTIEAVSFDAGSYDNCTANSDLVFLIEYPITGEAGDNPPSSAGTSQVFDCDDLGLRELRLWVGDEDGNWDFCVTEIIIQNNMGEPCSDDLTGGIIAGLINTEGSEAVESVQVKETSSLQSEITTGIEGLFQFMNVPLGSHLSIEPKRNDALRNGVTTMDILLIQRHILGIERLDSPYKLIAADVNNNGAITGSDLVEIRRVILGTSNEFTDNESWRFVSSDYEFINPENPFGENFPEIVNIYNYNGNQPAIRFVGIKIGDVDNTARANSSNLQGLSSRSNKALTFELDDVDMKAGNTYSVSFKANEFKNIVGYQFTMSVDPSAVALTDIEGGALQVSEHNFGLTQLGSGIITTSWNDIKGIHVNDGEELFTLTFNARRDAKLSEIITVNSSVTEAEAYEDGVAEELAVDLRFNTATGTMAAAEFELFQNRPNPFDGETLIGFNLPEAGQASITVYDVSGRVLKLIEGDFAQGYNEVRLTRNDLRAVGVMYYELRTANATATKKMLLID